MPQPTLGDAHVDVPLSNVSVAHQQTADMFGHARVFPDVPVQKQTDLYWVYDRSHFFRDQMQKRRSGAESAGSGWSQTTEQYRCDVWALHKDLGEQEMANADDDPEEVAAIFLSQQAMIRKEKEYVAAAFTTGVWTGSSTGGDIDPGNWSAGGADAPISDIQVQYSAILENTGYKPNKFVCTHDVWAQLKQHPDFLDRISGGATVDTPAIVLKQLFAQIIEVDEVIVLEAVENTANEGATAAYAFIGGSARAWLGYVAPNPSRYQPSAGYTFSWNGYLGMAGLGTRIKTFDMYWLETKRVEIDCAFDVKVVSPDCGAFFIDALS